MGKLDGFEDGLIDSLRQHEVLRNLDLLTDVDFFALLLQRRFLSLAFTPAYDLAIDLLQDEKGLRVARVILREEYPGSEGYTRSHREDMKEDLLQLGVLRKDLVASRPTPVTAQTITETFDLIADAGKGDCADARLLTVLRFWGEVLVSVEYGALWGRMQRQLVSGGVNRSVFYHPHHCHDAKVRPLEEASVLAATHSDQLGTRLWQLLDSQRATDLFREAETAVLGLKTRFYDQFVPMLDGSRRRASVPT